MRLEKQWKHYSNFENEFIEEVFQRKECEIQINDHAINFQHQVQYKKNDQT